MPASEPVRRSERVRRMGYKPRIAAVQKRNRRVCRQLLDRIEFEMSRQADRIAYAMRGLALERHLDRAEETLRAEFRGDPPHRDFCRQEIDAIRDSVADLIPEMRSELDYCVNNVMLAVARISKRLDETEQ